MANPYVDTFFCRLIKQGNLIVSKHGTVVNRATGRSIGKTSDKVSVYDAQTCKTYTIRTSRLIWLTYNGALETTDAVEYTGKLALENLYLTRRALRRTRDQVLADKTLRLQEYNKPPTTDVLLASVKVRRFASKRRNALRDGFDWDLKFRDVQWPTHCPVLGIELDYFARQRQDNSPSFDRVDPHKGYVKGNVAVVSDRANRIKNDGTWQEHQKIVDWMRRKRRVG